MHSTEAVKELAKLAGLVKGTKGAESEQARIAALKEVLDRGHGKATQAVDLNVAQRDIENLTDAELEDVILRQGSCDPCTKRQKQTEAASMPRGSKPGERRGGRKKGVPNKAGRELREVAQEHTPAAIKTLAEICENGESEAARPGSQCSARSRSWEANQSRRGGCD